jgi:predicted TIM-barrel fold metal-dependent hydrolase
MLSQYPGKFLGLATLPLQAPESATQELERAVRELGFHGAVSYTSVQDKDLDAEELWPVYAKAEELNVPIVVHPVNTGPIAGGWRLTRHYKTRAMAFGARWETCPMKLASFIVRSDLPSPSSAERFGCQARHHARRE